MNFQLPEALTHKDVDNMIEKEKFINEGKPIQPLFVLLGSTKVPGIYGNDTEQEKIFGDRICEPGNTQELISFLSDNFNKAYNEKKIVVLLIACHGSNNKDNYSMQFEGTKYDFSAKWLSNLIKEYKKDILSDSDIPFQCVGLIQACYSDYFDITCFDASIKLGVGVSKWGVLLKPLLQIDRQKNFTLGSLLYRVSDALQFFLCWNDGAGKTRDLKNCTLTNNVRFHKLEEEEKEQKEKVTE